MNSYNISRRKFLKNSTTLGVTSLMGVPWILQSGNFRAGETDQNMRFLQNDAESFSFVTIPDTHLNYKCTKEHLTGMSKWIVKNKQNLNIRFVAHLGDVGDRRGTGPILEMQKHSRQALEPINQANIPLTVCIGNHDYDEVSSVRNTSGWNDPEVFGLSMYEDKPWFGGCFENEVPNPGIHPGGSINHYLTIHTAERQFLILTLEMGPREKVMEWANDLVHNKYPEHHVIVFTHSYLHLNGERVKPGTSYNPKQYDHFATDTGPEYTNDGQDLWEKHFRKWENLLSVHSGHAINEPTQAYKKSTGDHGNMVHEFYNNWQNWGFDTESEEMIFGQGSTFQATMIRIFNVDILENEVVITNYLPVLDKKGEPSIPESYSFL